MTTAAKPARDVRRAHPRDEFEVALRDHIANHRIPPGSKLNEVDLAQEFNVSRTQVREAIASLALRGLIERIPNRGAVVRKLDPQRVAEIFAVREVLEGMCARLAAQRSRPSDWEPHVRLMEAEMPQHLAQGDFEAFLAGYESFRRDIIRIAGNSELSAMLDSIREKISYLSSRIVILPGRGEEALREHRAVLEALRRGDADAAEALRKATMRNGLAWFNRFQRFML